jgi:hypothetical protein
MTESELKVTGTNVFVQLPQLGIVWRSCNSLYVNIVINFLVVYNEIY